MPIGIIKNWIDNKVAARELEKEKKAQELQAATKLEEERVRRVQEARIAQDREKKAKWNAQIDNSKKVVEWATTSCLSNPDSFIHITQDIYRDAGVDFDAETENGISYADLLKKLSPETKKFIENEINEGSIPVLMPGRSELQKSLSLYLEALKVRSVVVKDYKLTFKKIDTSFKNGYYYKWGEDNTPDISLKEDIPDEPYLLLVSQENKVDVYGERGSFFKRLELLRNKSSKPKTAGVNGVLNLGEFMPAFLMENTILQNRHIINCDPRTPWGEEQEVPRSVSFVDNFGGPVQNGLGRIDLPYVTTNSSGIYFQIYDGYRGYGTLPTDNKLSKNGQYPLLPPRYVTRIPLGT